MFYSIHITVLFLVSFLLVFSLSCGLAHNGWLAWWQARHNVKMSILSGESGDVDKSVVEDWSKRLDSVCAGYKLQDIFNADETGLFYRVLPSRSLVSKGDDCKVVRSQRRE